MQTQSDVDLLLQAGAGNRQAAARLIREHSPKILGIATRMLNDSVEAEDIVQETFIRVWKAAPKWKPGGAKVSTWICKIAMNLCLDRLRKKKSAPLDDVPEIRDGAARPEQQMELDSRSRMIRQALSNLPERQRAALSLCYFQELSNIEAADIMDVSVDALESLLSRGRRALKAALSGLKDELMIETPLGRSSLSGEG